jgi:DNA-binding CsgD family transcriptional regulator
MLNDFSDSQIPEFSVQLSAQWLTRAMDEIDYGVLLLVDASLVLYLNHAARAELDGEHPLQLLGKELRARDAQDVTRLHEALAGATRGLRKLVTLGQRGNGVSIAVVPLGHLADGSKATLLMLGKQRVCEQLSVQWFARSHALTPAETRVLEALCGGMRPREIAEEFNVGMATVRTQIGNILAKVGADSIRELLRLMAVLPPMLNSLRLAA